jgi:hypothetical protein
VTLAVNDLDLVGTINAGANAVNLTTGNTTTPTVTAAAAVPNAARGIDLGSTAGGTLNISSAELSRITTSGLLTIGDAAHTGLISINSAISNAAGATGGLTIVNKTGGIAVNAPLT